MYLKATFGNRAISSSYWLHTYYAVNAFLSISAQTWAHLLLSDGSASCTIFSLFKAFCVLPGRSTYCKSLANTVYFHLGLNICGSQMKETSPRESFGFYQLIDEVVYASPVRFWRSCVPLIEGVKVQKRVSEEKSRRFTSFREYCLILPSVLLHQSELAVSTSHVHLIPYWVKVGFTRYIDLRLWGLPEARPM